MKLIRCYGINNLVKDSKNKESRRVYPIGYEQKNGIMLGCRFNKKYYTFAIYSIFFMTKESHVEMRFERNHITDVEAICNKVIECYNSIY